MTRSPTQSGPRGGRLALLLAVVAAGAIAWLAAGGDPSAVSIEGGSAAEQGLLPTVLEGEAWEPTSGPGLVGQLEGASVAADTVPAAPHAPLVVRCLAPDGSPLPRARVQCVQGLIADPLGNHPGGIGAVFTATADEQGLARFDAVPQDGSHVARFAPATLGDPARGSGILHVSDLVFVSVPTPGAGEPRWTVRASDGELARLDQERFRAGLAAARERMIAPGSQGREPSARARVPEPSLFAKDRSTSAWHHHRPAEGAEFPLVVVHGPDVTLQQTTGLPVLIRPVDATTGVERDDLAQALLPSFADLASADGVPTWSRLTPGTPGNSVLVHTGAEESGALLATRVRFDVPLISRFAEELVAEVPVWPEADIRLHLPAAAGDGLPLEVTGITLDGEHVEAASVEPDGGGAFLLRGVPHRPGALLTGTVSSGGRAWGVTPTHLSAQLGERANVDLGAVISPIRGTGSPFALTVNPLPRQPLILNASGRVAVTDALVLLASLTEAKAEPGSAEHAPATPGRATLVVRVVPAPGSSLRRAAVLLGDRVLRPNGFGVVAFDDLAPGTVTVLVEGAGPSVHASIEDLQPGERREIEISIPAPLTLDVVVVDEAGREMPFAEISVEQASGLPWTDLDGTRQRIDPYVDAQGRRTLRGLFPGKTVVKARVANRLVGQGEFDGTAGGRAQLRVVVSAERPPPTPTPQK